LQRKAGPGGSVTGRRLDRRASWTAQVCAAQRAAETLRPPDSRRLDDPYSRYFVRHPALRAMVSHPLAARALTGTLDHLFPGLQAFTVLRVRYVDDIYRAAINDGIDQLVLLGAGFDTTSLRWQETSVTIFEVDAPSTLKDKRVISEELLRGGEGSQVTWVPCDFEHDALRERLLSSGFDPTRPSLVVWIEVSLYLTPDAITTTLADLATLCAPRSQLVFDYIDANVITGKTRWKGARRAARAVALRGEPYRSGFTSTDVGSLLAAHGFECHEHVRTPELLQRYAPAHVSRPAGNDWQAITTAQRIHFRAATHPIRRIEYGGLPVKYSIFRILLLCNIIDLRTLHARVRC
jgi:methyltransferase (TIGR00027 family)